MKSIPAAMVVLFAYCISFGQTFILEPHGDTTDTIFVTIFSNYPELLPVVNNYRLYEYSEFNPFPPDYIKSEYKSVLDWLKSIKPKDSQDTSGTYVKVWELNPKNKYALTNGDNNEQKFVVIKPDTVEWLYAANYNIWDMITPSGVYIWSRVFEKNGDITDLGYSSMTYTRNPDTSSISLTRYVRSNRYIRLITSRKYWKNKNIHHEYKYDNLKDFKSHKPSRIYEYDKDGNEIKREFPNNEN
jgi:hypothetical protein